MGTAIWDNWNDVLLTCIHVMLEQSEFLTGMIQVNAPSCWNNNSAKILVAYIMCRLADIRHAETWCFVHGHCHLWCSSCTPTMLMVSFPAELFCFLCSSLSCKYWAYILFLHSNLKPHEHMCRKNNFTTC